MYTSEEELTRIFFGRIAGRELSADEIKTIVSDVKRVAEIVRSTDWLRRALRKDSGVIDRFSRRGTMRRRATPDSKRSLS